MILDHVVQLISVIRSYFFQFTKLLMYHVETESYSRVQQLFYTSVINYNTLFRNLFVFNCRFIFKIYLITHWKKVAFRLRTSLCLQFKPHHIAAGAIFLAAKFLKVKLPSDGEKVWWQEFDVTPRQLEGRCHPLNSFAC